MGTGDEEERKEGSVGGKRRGGAAVTGRPPAATLSGSEVSEKRVQRCGLQRRVQRCGCKVGVVRWPYCLVHRAGHPELRLEQILCVLPRLQAPPQLLQLRLLLRDAVAQVLDLGLRGLQLALLARRPKLLLQVFSHRSEPTLARNAGAALGTQRATPPKTCDG